MPNAFRTRVKYSHGVHTQTTQIYWGENYGVLLVSRRLALRFRNGDEEVLKQKPFRPRKIGPEGCCITTKSESCLTSVVQFERFYRIGRFSLLKTNSIEEYFIYSFGIRRSFLQL